MSPINESAKNSIHNILTYISCLFFNLLYYILATNFGVLMPRKLFSHYLLYKLSSKTKTTLSKVNTDLLWTMLHNRRYTILRLLVSGSCGIPSPYLPIIVSNPAFACRVSQRFDLCLYGLLFSSTHDSAPFHNRQAVPRHFVYRKDGLNVLSPVIFD